MFKNRNKVIDLIKKMPVEAGIATFNGIQSASNIYQLLGSIYDKTGDIDKSRVAYFEAIDGLETMAELLVVPLRELEEGPPVILTASPMDIPHRPINQNRRRK